MPTVIDNTRTNPFVGLRPFRSDEGQLFFGRLEQATELLEKLHHTRFLGVVGSSGCGKSSLIRAGLIPKLKAGFLVSDRSRWRVATLQPGAAPLANLAAALLTAAEKNEAPVNSRPAPPPPDQVAGLVTALRRSGAAAAVKLLTPALGETNANLLLLIDQFEELFHFGIASQNPDKRDEATIFASVMLELTRQDTLPIYAVMTMRSDYLGECDNFFGLPEALNLSQYLVPRLTRRQRQQAIEGPVRLFSARIAPRLVDRVLNDMGDQSDQLPVMQHALMRTWDHWQPTGDPALDLRHYQDAGTVEDALSKDADRALEGMNKEERRTTRLMFQALTNTDARNRRVRRPAHLSELQAVTGASEAQLRGIIERFQRDGRTFLNIEDEQLSDDPLVDISHESLIRQWRKLGKWLEDEADSREIYMRLADASARYEKDRAEGRLWRDPELALARRWYTKRQPNEAWARRYHPEGEAARGFSAATNFLDASYAAHEDRLAAEKAAQEEKEAQRQRELAAARKLRWLSCVLSAALLLSAGLGAFAYTRNEALREQTKKLEEARESEQTQKEEAVRQKGLAEGKTAELRKAQQGLQESYFALRAETKKAEAARLRAEALHRATQAANVALKKSEQDLRETGMDLKYTLERAEFAKDEALKNAATAEEARKLAEKNKIELQNKVDIINEQRSQILAAYSRLVRDKVEEAPDLGALLAAHALLRGPREDAPAAVEAEKNHTLTQDANQVARKVLYEDHMAERVADKEKRLDGISGLLTSTTNGRLLTLVSDDGTVRVLDAGTGAVQGQTARVMGRSLQTALSQDGRYIATAEQAQGYFMRQNPPERSDGSNLATDERAEGVVRTWRVEKDAVGQLSGKELKVRSLRSLLSVALSPDGAWLATGGDDGLRLWDSATGREVGIEKEAKPKGPAQVIAFSPLGGLLAVNEGDLERTRSDGTQPAPDAVHLLDASTGRVAGPKITLDCACVVRSLVFDREGKYLVIGMSVFKSSDGREDGRTQVWPLSAPESGGKRGSVLTLDAAFTQAAFSKDRNYLALADGELTVKVWRLRWRRESGIEVATIGNFMTMIHDDPVRALVFSEDESQLTAVSDRGVARVWKTGGAAPTGMSLPGNNSFPEIAFNKQGKLLATADGRKIRKLDAPGELTLPFPPDEELEAFEFNQDGTRLVTLSNKGHVRVADVSEPWDRAETRIKEAPLPSEWSGKLDAVALSPSGRLLALRRESAMEVISLGDGGASKPVLPIKDTVEAFAFNRDETSLATVTIDSRKKNQPCAKGDLQRRCDTWSVNIWNLVNPESAPKQIPWEQAVGRRVTAVAFRPQGDYLVASAQGEDEIDGVLGVFNLSSLTEKETFKTSLKNVRGAQSIVFDRTGRHLLLGMENGAELWRFNWGAQSAKKVAELSERAHKFIFDQENKYLAVAGHRRVSSGIWRAGDMAKDICSRLGRNLTYGEWQRYSRGLPYTRTCNNLPVHQTMIDEAIGLVGTIREDEALDLFKQIKNADPGLGVQPEKEVEWHKLAKKHDKKLNDADKELSQISRDGTAYELNRRRINTQLSQAFDDYKQALKFYDDKSDYRSVFSPVDKSAPGFVFPRKLAAALNSICWWGSIYDRASEVYDGVDKGKSACAQAWLADPYNGGNLDTLAVAKALTAKSTEEDEAAIRDFKWFVLWVSEKGWKARRSCYIDYWKKSGKNPFRDSNMRETLLKELYKDSPNDNSAKACEYGDIGPAKP